MTKNELVNMVILAGNTIAEDADDIVGNLDNVSDFHFRVTIKGDKDEGFKMEIQSHREG